MKSFSLMVIIIILSVLTGCVDKPTQTSTLGNINGTVFDQSNNSEFSGVTVSIHNVGNRTTNSNGYYEFIDLKENIYTVYAEKTGYVIQSQQIEVESNKTKELNFALHTAQPARLLVNPTFLNFGQTETSLNLSVNNGGDEKLSWQVVSNQTWLTTFPSTGTTTSETDEVIVTINRGGLTVGNYTGALSFTSDGGDFTVPVAMVVTPVVLNVTPTTLNFGSSETQLSFTISNTGTGELNWNLISNQNWITANSSSGTTVSSPQTVAVTINRAGLSPNNYNGTISINSNGGNKVVNISMVVLEVPPVILSVTPTTLDFGSNKTQLSFSISNIGNGELNWNLISNQNWITANSSSGTTTTSPKDIVVTINRAGLSPNNYNGTISINSNGGNKVVNISMVVLEVPPVILSVTPTALDFGSNKTQMSFTISNVGNSNLNLNWTLVPNKSWITVNPTSGTTTSSSRNVTVTIDKAGLNPNSYNGSIAVNSNGGNKVVNISMVVLEETNFVEHFNNLDNWVNTTYSDFIHPEAWILDGNGYSGSCAKSECSAHGAGDQLTRTFNFPTSVTAKIWAKKFHGGYITIYFKVDGITVLAWDDALAWGSNWTQLQFNIPAGEHEIMIETDYSGTVWIDELEIIGN